MSYTDKKITQEEINAHHVQGATDHLIGNAQQNKAVFDDLPEFIAEKHNELIDELNSHHGDEIKVAVDEWLAEHPEVTTTVQDNSLTTAKYVDGSVTEPKIADGAVTPSKLDRAYSTPADLASVNANLTNEINVLDARMDEFASLPEGSTSGNAELVDIRVGTNGTTYSTAGDAVRGQVGDLQSEFAVLNEDTKKTLISRPTEKRNGIVNINGQIVNETNNYMKHFVISVNAGERVYWTTWKMAVGAPAYGFIDGNGNYFGIYDSGGNGLQETGVAQVPAKAEYMFLNANTWHVYDMLVYSVVWSEYAKKPITWNEQTPTLEAGLVRANGGANRGVAYETLYETSANFKHIKIPASYADNGKLKVQHSNFGAVQFGRVIFVDSDDVVLDWIEATETSGLATIEIDDMPFNTAYVICNYDNVSNPKYWKAEATSVNEFVESSINSWYGKKIVWFGTSISACGYIGKNNAKAIPQRVGELLGATVINEAIGSSCVHAKVPRRINESSNPYGFYENFEKVSRCLTNTAEEMQWIIDHYADNIWTTGKVSSMTTELANQILANSYETKLDQYLTSETFPDLFVFEHGYNDWWNAKAEQDGYYSTYGDSEIYSFRAGMDFLIKRILDYNPRAKIILIGNYCGFGENGTLSGDIPAMQEQVMHDWNLPMLKQWERLGWSAIRTIKPYGYWQLNGGAYTWVTDTSQHEMTVLNAWLPDNTHPHVDPTGKAVQKMVEELSTYIKNEVSLY